MGADAEQQRFVMTQMQQPLDTESLVAATRGRPELGAQIYSASLLAIEVDTPAERAYLGRLASGLGLDSQVVGRIESMVGLGPA